IASSYNIYRSTESGGETLIASGVTATYFFDTGLASNGTSYFYQVSAVNMAGESGRTKEASATPSPPAGLLFSDDFSNGPSSLWIFTPEKDYWLPQVGQLTDARGDTVASVAQTATIAFSGGVVIWRADLLTKEGYGAGVDQRGNPGISGISVRSPDGLYGVSFSVFPDFTVNVGTTINGVFQGWTRVGRADPILHHGSPEMLWHTYDIRLDSGGTFSVIFDGNLLRSGINAGPASAWDDGIGTGTLFTLSDLDDRHLSTFFDNVRALGVPSAPRGSREIMAFAKFGLSDITTHFDQFRAIQSVGEGRASKEVFVTAQAVVSDAPAELLATAGDGQVRPSRPSARVNGIGGAEPLIAEALL